MSVIKSFRRGEKGFTLIEIVIVVSILGIISSVIVPNVGGFLGTANLAAANNEVAAVTTASRAFYADTDSWPVDSDSLYPVYLSKEAEARYSFDSNTGWIDVGSGDEGNWGALGFTYDSDNWSWVQ